ncbi:MAG: hypothetical protein IKR68_05195 [Lachnospiraceae bacterium]|nr:hypothetical protein [Lachnospiraceae bacterium]
MKQIIVVTNHREKIEKEFPKTGLQITWSTLSIEDLITKRDRSNVIFVYLNNDDFDDLNKMGLYLRDMCIEDEKIIYLYGNKADVNVMQTLIPSLYIKSAMYSFSHFNLMVEDIVRKEVFDSAGKPRFLILDDDIDYVEKLRIYLDPHFTVYVSRFDVNEIGPLILRSDIAMISMEGTLKLSEFMGLFSMLLARKKNARFKFYYLTATNTTRNSANSGSENNSISFSKEMEPYRIANYFIKHIND